jgi:transcriptional regulator with XRE-family HTH domain
MDNPLLTQWLTQPGGLARRLADMAERAGLNGADLANLVGRDPGTISRYLNGRVVPPVEVIRAWCEVCDQVEQTQVLLDLQAEADAKNIPWRRRVAIGVEGTQEAFTVLHRRSTLVRMHSGPYIPGPLQTGGYAAAMLEAYARSVAAPVEGIREAVEHRMARAELVGTTGHDYRFVIHEAALISGPPSHETLLEQANHLMAMLPECDIRILPLRGGLPVVGMSTYAIYTIDDSPFVIEETTTDDHEWQTVTEVQAFEAHFERMTDACVPVEETRDVIDLARRRLAALI